MCNTCTSVTTTRNSHIQPTRTNDWHCSGLPMCSSVSQLPCAEEVLLHCRTHLQQAWQHQRVQEPARRHEYLASGPNRLYPWIQIWQDVSARGIPIISISSFRIWVWWEERGRDSAAFTRPDHRSTQRGYQTHQGLGPLWSCDSRPDSGSSAAHPPSMFEAQVFWARAYSVSLCEACVSGVQERIQRPRCCSQWHSRQQARASDGQASADDWHEQSSCAFHHDSAINSGCVPACHLVRRWCHWVRRWCRLSVRMCPIFQRYFIIYVFFSKLNYYYIKL